MLNHPARNISEQNQVLDAQFANTFFKQWLHIGTQIRELLIKNESPRAIVVAVP